MTRWPRYPIWHARSSRIFSPFALFAALGFLASAAPSLSAQVAPRPDAPPSRAIQHSPQSQPNSQPQSGAPPQQTPNSSAPPAASSPAAAQPANSSTAAIPTLRISANLVDLFFLVHDKHGKLIPNLTHANCQVFDDGKLQTLQHFSSQSDLPLSLGILLDTSLSQERVLPQEQQDAGAFLRHILRPKDEAFLISFDVTVDMLSDWTSNLRDLQRALQAAQVNSNSGNYANGTIPSITKPKGTLLYDAVYLASNDKLRQETGRKALILLTDGRDEGSQEKLQSAIEAAQKADAIVYVLLISDPGVYGTLDFSGTSAMRKLVEATGGEVFPIGKNAKKLSAAFEAIEAQLRTQYLASYVPANDAQDGSYHRTRIECRQNGKSLRVQARQGYYASPH